MRVCWKSRRRVRVLVGQPSQETKTCGYLFFFRRDATRQGKKRIGLTRSGDETIEASAASSDGCARMHCARDGPRRIRDGARRERSRHKKRNSREIVSAEIRKTPTHLLVRPVESADAEVDDARLERGAVARQRGSASDGRARHELTRWC